LAARLSQEELGRQVGLDRTMVGKIEADTRRMDAVELSPRICVTSNSNPVD